MKDLPVRIVKLEPMSLICFNGYGAEPETQALSLLYDWAKQHDQHGRIFGYNNPDPAEGSPNYGYDACMVVPADTATVEGSRIRHLDEGLYAVLNCPVREPWVDIPGSWKALVQWADSNDYSLGSHQWLEEHLPADKNESDVLFTLNLYMPIKKG